MSPKPSKDCPDVADLFESGGQLPLQIPIIARAARKIVKILQCATYNQPAGRCRAGQVRDRVMDLEHERMSQTSNFIETLFGERTLMIRAMRLPGSRDETTDQTQENQNRGCDSSAMAANELSAAISERILARSHRQICEVPPNVFGKLSDRGVATLRLFPYRHEHDVIEVGAKRPGSSRVGVRSSELVNYRTGSRGILLGDDSSYFIGPLC